MEEYLDSHLFGGGASRAVAIENQGLAGKHPRMCVVYKLY